MATSISAQHEELLQKAVSSGRFKGQEEALTEAIRLLGAEVLGTTETSNGSAAENQILPPRKWVEEFDRITASRQGGDPRMDDSRESIYGDRGS